ncbi:transcriptional regulator domain-containing protein [Sphingosinicella xenopeptidilytica]|uniref:Transcriptional regulator domain-containing protein n=1 Tax=Sphingosinicella xenopeptidilytica TaxID=364098 RepID=A0ABW3C6X2_SPHXN
MAREGMMGLDAQGFAWEFLRRNPAYRRLAVDAVSPTGKDSVRVAAPAAWGLHFRGRPRPPRRAGACLLAERCRPPRRRHERRAVPGRHRRAGAGRQHRRARRN